MIWLAAAAVTLVLLRLLLQGRGREARRERGLTDAATLELDTRTLYSARLGLTGRADRLFRDGAATIPEEWKSARRVHDSHRAQLGCYLILVEEETGVRPSYGVFVLDDGSRVTVENTPALRETVLGVAERIRAARRELGRAIPVRQPPGKCRGCGMREGCGRDAGRGAGEVGMTRGLPCYGPSHSTLLTSSLTPSSNTKAIPGRLRHRHTVE